VERRLLSPLAEDPLPMSHSPVPATAASLPSAMLSLSEHERRKILDLIETLPHLKCPGEIDETALLRLEVLQRAMPERLLRTLLEFRRSSGPAGALIVRGLPTDRSLCPTPADGRPAADKATSISEYTLLLTMLALGEHLCYLDEKEGALIQNICPVRGQEEKQENTGSGYLELHVEDGFHPHKPDYLGLVALRADHELQAKTVTAGIGEVLHRLPSQAIELLRLPLYRIAASTSFGEGGAARRVRVLSGHLLAPDLCLDHHLMEATTPAAAWALALLKSLLLAAAREHVMIPGDLLVVDNRAAVHGRTRFAPRFDGQDRWLQRLFVVRDLRRSSASRSLGGRQCAPLAAGKELGLGAWGTIGGCQHSTSSPDPCAARVVGDLLSEMPDAATRLGKTSFRSVACNLCDCVPRILGGA
jgi:L-asparagine oxygenase